MIYNNPWFAGYEFSAREIKEIVEEGTIDSIKAAQGDANRFTSSDSIVAIRLQYSTVMRLCSYGRLTGRCRRMVIRLPCNPSQTVSLFRMHALLRMLMLQSLHRTIFSLH